MSAPKRPDALQKSIDNTQVSYKRVGNSGLKLSVPILGAMSFGHKDWQPWVVDDYAEVEKLLLAAWDRGLNTWDTANVYSNGVSEQMIGDVITKNKLDRKKLTILTKCYGTVGEEPAASHIRFPEMKKTRDYVNQGGLSRAAIFNAVDASLARLQTSYIDLLQIHRYDYDTPAEETMKALHDLVSSGKVRYIGASSMWAFQFAELQTAARTNHWTPFISMQNHYSLCYREEEREMNKYCAATGVGLIPWAPLYRGHLARPLGSASTVRNDSSKAANTKMDADSLTEEDKIIIGRVEELAKKKGWKMSQVALAWTVQKGANPIVGFSGVGRLDEAVAMKGKELTEDEMKYLEEPYVAKSIVGHS